jgi:virulence-associated protein VapD
LFFSCSKDDPKPYVPVKRCPDLTRNRDTINTYIHGTWEWIEEKRFDRLTGIVYVTPQSNNSYHITLKYSGDTAYRWKNNIIDSIYRFRIEDFSVISNIPEDTIPVVSYYSFYTNEWRGAVPILVCKDQLLMQYQLVTSGGGEEIWLRLNLFYK